MLAPLLLLSLSGCAGKEVREPSASRLQAIAHTRRGIEQQASGHSEQALAEFSDALRLQSSIENTDGMIVALINVARTQRLEGDLPPARAAIDRAGQLLQEPSDLAAELFFERAKILLAAGDLAGARESASRAEAAERGGDLGRRGNLVAHIMLRQGEPDQARAQAEKALKLNKSYEHAGEEANSWRLLGEINLLQGMNDKALDCFGAALSLDKELGFGGKIAADLRGMGGALLKKKEVPRALGFYRRALEVSLTRGDLKLAAEDMVLLARLYRQEGDQASADKLDEERKKLQVK